MPATQTHATQAEKIRHEEFCTPRPGNDGPRIESYDHLVDDLESGRSRPAFKVTRCMECGAAYYDPKEK